MSSFAVSDNGVTPTVKSRRVVESNEPMVLTDIYQDDCNIAIWKREFAPKLQQQIGYFLESNSSFQSSMIISRQGALSSIHQALGGSKAVFLLSEDIAELVDMFCCLFELDRAGLRLTALERAMCPRFHVDRVPCRLVTTYQGVATQWLSHSLVDRSKLGRGSEGKPDEESGLFQSANDIRQLNQGSVALYKGELWEGNEGAGLVHRSPAVLPGERRLLLTLDIN